MVVELVLRFSVKGLRLFWDCATECQHEFVCVKPRPANPVSITLWSAARQSPMPHAAAVWAYIWNASWALRGKYSAMPWRNRYGHVHFVNKCSNLKLLKCLTPSFHLTEFKRTGVPQVKSNFFYKYFIVYCYSSIISNEI